jgi:hypothetical protein
MSQLGRISGQLLKDNLTRQGTDLAFDTDLLYLNVNSRYVSINTDITSKPLFVNGEFYSTNFNTTSIDGITSFNLDFVANSIISQNNLNLVASAYVFADNIRTDNISIDNNSIVTLQSNSNLELRPNGTGTVEIQSNTNITGNLTATGSITLDGNIIFGDSDTDNVTFLADINTDIIPDQNEFYNLGTNLKRWNTVYPELVNGEEITSLEMLSGGVNLALRQGNIWYVAANGSNSNVGDHQSGPFATIAKALSEATAGDTVFIYPGTYTEITPLTVPAGVSVRGFDLRSVNIIPDSTTTSENIFLLNGETTVSDLTIKNFYYDSVNDTGYAFSFAPGMTVTSRSPYVQNVTVLTQGTTITVDDPRGFASGDAGQGAKVDGSLATAVSKEASMLFHSVTFITPGVDALVMTNGVRVEWLNSFTYFANRSIYATQGTLGLASLGIRFGAELRSIGSASVYGNYGAEASGASTLMYLIQHNFAYIGAGKDVTNDPSLNISANETIELGGGKIYYQSLDNKGNFKVGDAFGVSFETGRVTISGIGVGAGGVTSITLANGTDETVIDATEVLVNNIRFSGNTLSSIYGDVNLDSATNELNTTNNVTAINDIDITGDFTVDGMLTIGNAFIDVVEFVAPVDYGLRAIIDNTHSLGNSTKRWDDVIVFDSYIGNLKVSDNVITTLDSNADLELRADGTGRIYVPVDNVEFDQNLTVNGTSYTKNVSLIGSLLQAGNIQRTGDTTTGNYTQIGNQTVNGNGLYDDVLVTGNSITSSSSNANLVLDAAGTGRIYIPFSDVQVINDFVVEGLLDGSIASVTTSTTAQTYSNNNISIGTNIIQTTVSNSDLELRAAGTGRIYIPSDDVEFDQNLTVDNTTNLSGTNITGSLVNIGTITHTGNTGQTGNRYITGDLTVSSNVDFGDIEFINNRLITTRSNSNLEFKTAGIGKVYIPSNDVKVDNNLTVNLNTQVNAVTVTTDTVFTTYSNGNISIGTNIIETTVSNSDLELRAAGTGRIYVPNDNVEINNDLNVNDTTNLDNTNVTGLLDYTGNITRTGTTTQIGNQIITGDLTVSSNIDFGDIEFINNRLITTRSNSDLEFKTSGSGVVKFISPTRFEQAATFNNVFTSNITNSNTVTSNIFYNGNIEFYDNNLRTTNSNSDLVLLANNTGTISMPLDPLVLGQDFTVTLSSTLKNTTINGLLQHVGATVQTGNNTQTGNFVLTGDLTVGNDAYFENVNFINNQITTVNSNSNLELRAAGSGAVIINDNLILGQGLTVTGLSSTVTISNSALITSEKFVNNDILIQDNYITTTQSNSNLVLSGELTGGPRLERIKFDNNKISTTTGNENIVIQGTTNNIIFNTISAVKIPTGTDAQRPTLAQADLRFNTTETLFNGYSGAKVTFGGVYSADQRTNLTAHPTNNTLNFVANLIPSATISSTGINLNGLSTDNNLLFNGNTISSQSLNSDIFFTTNGTGQVKIDDLGVRSNQFNNLNTTQPLILQNTGFGYIQFAGTGGLVIPAGDISQRPLNPETGDIRWNNEDEQAEVFNGTQYQSFQGDSGTTLTGEEVEDVTNLWALILG